MLVCFTAERRKTNHTLQCPHPQSKTIFICTHGFYKSPSLFWKFIAKQPSKFLSRGKKIFSNTHWWFCDLDIMQRQLSLKFPFRMEPERKVKVFVSHPKFLDPQLLLAQEKHHFLIYFFSILLYILPRKCCHVCSRREKSTVLKKKSKKNIFGN